MAETYSLNLEDHALSLIADDQRTAILDGISDAVSSISSPSGGVFLHATFSSDAAEHVCSLGSLSCSRLLAAARVTRYWMGPAFGSKASDIPHDTQFLLLELEKDAKYALLLPLIDDRMRATLHGTSASTALLSRGAAASRADELTLHIESGDPLVAASRVRALYAAAGSEPFALLRRGFAEVAAELGSFRTLGTKTLPPSVESFGWCTWDAFYSNVEPVGVVDGLRALRDAGVPPRSLILDDGWQQVTPLAAADVEAAEAVDKKAEAAEKADEAKVASQLSASQPAAWKRLPTSLPTSLQSACSAAVAACSAAVAAVARWLSALLIGAIATVFEAYYERFVKRAAHGTLPTLIWRALTSSVLKGQLWGWFDSETDFGRQLSGFTPNSKFETAEGGGSGRDGGGGSNSGGGSSGGSSSGGSSSGGSSSGGSEGRTLKELVRTVKTQLGIRHVYCWHALHGYWRGVSSALGEAAGVAIVQVTPTPSRHLLTLEPQIAWDTPALFGVGLASTEADAASLYDAMHAPLVAAGVDGVKIDVQSGVPAMGGGLGGGPYLARIYTKAMEASVAQSFGVKRAAAKTTGAAAAAAEGGGDPEAGAAAEADDKVSPASQCINCMCHSTETLYQYSTTALARASDDFYPRRPDSHTVHLVNVAYNSIFLGEICLPDW